MITEFKHEGKTFTVARPGPGEWVLTAYGMSFIDKPDMDLDYEFEANETAWRQYIEELFVEVGFIAYSEIMECYVLVTEQEILEEEVTNEWEWAAEHERQESRSDIFI